MEAGERHVEARESATWSQWVGRLPDAHVPENPLVQMSVHVLPADTRTRDTSQNAQRVRRVVMRTVYTSLVVHAVAGSQESRLQASAAAQGLRTSCTLAAHVVEAVIDVGAACDAGAAVTGGAVSAGEVEGGSGFVGAGREFVTRLVGAGVYVRAAVATFLAIALETYRMVQHGPRN